MHLENLDLNLLVAIEALLRRKSVTAAADELHLTQSAVSGALKRARLHFEDELFYYDGQSMVPTTFGQSLEKQVPAMITQLRGIARMRGTSDLRSLKRCFTIVASDYVSAVFISALSKHLVTVAPLVSLSVMPFTREAVGQFRRGVVDFLIGPNFSVEQGETAELLFEDSFKCVLWSENAALKTGFNRDDFFNAPMVLTNFFLGNGKSHFERWLDDQIDQVTVAASLPSFVGLPDFIAGTKNLATIHERLVPLYQWTDDLLFIEPPVQIPKLQEFLVTGRKHAFDSEAQLLATQMHIVARAMSQADA